MTKSFPPILDTSISPFLTEDSFRKKAINLNGAKVRTVIGWHPSVPRVSPLDLRLQAEAFQNAQLWQVLLLLPGLPMLIWASITNEQAQALSSGFTILMSTDSPLADLPKGKHCSPLVPIQMFITATI